MTRFSRALAFGLAVALAPFAQAQAPADHWPARPLRIIVPANAGGGTADPVSRVLAEELTKVFGQRVFIENRGGNNGNIGAAAAARAPNDGYTVLFSWAGTLATNISLYKSLPFHPVQDFDPVVLIGGVSNILVVNNSFPARNLKEFTAYVLSQFSGPEPEISLAFITTDGTVAISSRESPDEKPFLLVTPF